MIYTLRFKMAIRFAIKTHEVYQKQVRKGKSIAYITHPLTVGLILSQARAKEDVVIAGILHDTIEDSTPHKKVTPKMLTQRFGKTVAALVDSVTEHTKSDPWAKRKLEALEHIADFSRGSVLVKSADTMANVSDIIDDYGRVGDAAFISFHATKAKVIMNYAAVMTALIKKWPGSPLAGDLRELQTRLNSIEL